MKAKKLPANPERFASRLLRMRLHCNTNSPMMRLSPMVAMECKMVLSAYYGSNFKMAVTVLKEEIYLWRMSLNTRFLIWISDKVGWTKMYHVPETSTHREYWRRHGRKCSGSPNCNNPNCIEDSQPKWFQKLL